MSSGHGTGRTLVIVGHLAVAISGAGLVGPGNAVAEQTLDQGQALYDNHCGGCHTCAAHTRKNPLVRNMGELEQQVDRWQAQQNLGWKAEEKAAVVQYLNRSFYKF